MSRKLTKSSSVLAVAEIHSIKEEEEATMDSITSGTNNILKKDTLPGFPNPPPTTATPSQTSYYHFSSNSYYCQYFSHGFPKFGHHYYTYFCPAFPNYGHYYCHYFNQASPSDQHTPIKSIP